MLSTTKGIVLGDPLSKSSQGDLVSVFDKVSKCTMTERDESEHLFGCLGWDSGMPMKIYTVNQASILNEMFSKEILRKQQIIAPRNNYLQGLVA